MPSLRTKFPGFPRYGAGMAQSLSVQKSYITRVIGMSPVAYWPLNETSGVTAYDLSGNGLHGTYTNGPTLNNFGGPGLTMGNAPLLDGVNDFVQLPSAGLNSVFDSTKGTFSVWINLNEAWSATDSIVYFCLGSDANNRINAHKLSSNTIRGQYISAGNTNNNAFAFSASGWHHLLMTFSASKLHMFVDGVEQGSGANVTGTYSGALEDAWSQIGAQQSIITWKGWIAHAALFNRVLTPTEITLLATPIPYVNTYQSKVLGYGPIAYYPMNDTSGTQCTDVSGNALHGTYTNGPTLSSIGGPGTTMGGAPLFDGINDLVQLPAATLNNVFNPNLGTMAIWVNLNEAWADATLRDVFTIGVDNSSLITFYKGSNGITFVYQLGGVPSTTSLNMTGLSGWHHIGFTFDRNGSGRITPYLDGIVKPDAAASGGTWSGTLGNSKTRLSNIGDGYWSGWFAHTAVFDKALTSTQMADVARAV